MSDKEVPYIRKGEKEGKALNSGKWEMNLTEPRNRAEKRFAKKKGVL